MATIDASLDELTGATIIIITTIISTTDRSRDGNRIFGDRPATIPCPVLSVTGRGRRAVARN